jgi:hypothetical protein
VQPQGHDHQRKIAATLGPVDGVRDQLFADELDRFLRYIHGDVAAAARLLARTIGLAERVDEPDLVVSAHHSLVRGVAPLDHVSNRRPSMPSECVWAKLFICFANGQKRVYLALRCGQQGKPGQRERGELAMAELLASRVALATLAPRSGPLADAREFAPVSSNGVGHNRGDPIRLEPGWEAPGGPASSAS